MQDPGVEALRSVGADIGRLYPYIDPFGSMKELNHTNIALVYAGASPRHGGSNVSLVGQATQSSPHMLHLSSR